MVTRPRTHPLATLGLLCTLLVAALPLQAAFDAFASATRIDDSESLTVAFRYSGDSDGESPDFAPLARDFEVLSTRREEQVSLGFGSNRSVTTWQLNLAPRRRGRLTVPSLEFRGERSPVLSIEVRPPSAATVDRMRRLVFFDTAVDRDSTWVQAQVIYSVALYYAADVQLYGDVPPAPSLDDAIVQPLGGIESTSELRDGRRYQVIRQRYAVFPQRSGTLTIPGEAMSVSARLPASDGRGTRRRELRVRSDAISLQVRPPPASWPADQPWLPALDLDLADGWQPEGDTLTVGVPVDRDLLIRGVGVAASLLPELPMRVPDGVRAYPDAPVLREEPGPRGVTALRLQGTALIPASPGTLGVPPLSLTWFDVSSGSIREARLPGRSFQVLPAAGQAASPGPAAADQPSLPTAPASDTQAPLSAAPPGTLVWLLAALAALGWLLAVLLLLRQRRTPAATAAAPAAAPEADLARVQRDLLSACRRADAAAAGPLLTRWLALRRLQHGAEDPALAPAGPLAQARRGLEAQRFGGAEHPWDGSSLAAALLAASAGTAPGRFPGQGQGAALRPLYGR